MNQARLHRILKSMRRPSPTLVMGVLLAVGLSFTLAAPAHAIEFSFDWIWVNFAKFILWVAGFVGRLLVIAINQLIAVASYNDFGNSPAVTTGWVIVRDVANMTFIIFLLVIAFGTILRIENYRYNQLLSRLLLMAVLINFSKLITLFFIDFAQVVMLTFVSSFRDAAAGNLTTAFGLKTSLSFLASNPNVTDFSSLSVLVTAAMALAIYIIAFIVTLVIVIVLVIRVFALWVLIILSPLAYALRAFPNTRAQSSRWWSEFGKYVTTGPIVAFFLWLALTVMASGQLTQGFDAQLKNLNSSQEINNLSGVTDQTQDNGLRAALSDISSAPALLSFMFSIVFLLTGLSVAQGMGGAAGKIAGDWSDKIKKGGLKALSLPLAPAVGAAKLARYGAGALGRKVQTDLSETGKIGRFRIIPKGISGGKAPWITKEYWEGFRSRGERRRKQAMEMARGEGEGLAEDVALGVPRLFNKEQIDMQSIDTRGPARRKVITSMVSDMKKDIGTSLDARQEMQYLARRAFHRGGAEGQIMREAFIEMATQQGNLDDIFQDMMKDDQFVKDMEKNSGYKFRRDDDTESENFGQLYMDSENQTKFAGAFLGLDNKFFDQDKGKQAAIESTDEDQDKLRAMAALSEAAKDVGHWEQFTATRDAKSGKYYVMNEKDRMAEILGELKKRGVQTFNQQLATHPVRPRILDKRTGDWMITARHEDQGTFEKNFWHSALGPQNLPEARRMQARFVEHTIGKYYDSAGNLITDEKVAKARGFRNAEDVRNQRDQFQAENPEIFQGLVNLRFAGKVDGTGPGKAGWKPTRISAETEALEKTITDHVKVPDIQAITQRHGLNLTDNKLIDLQQNLADPKFGEAYEQYTQSRIQERLRATGRSSADEVIPSLYNEAMDELEKQLRSTLGAGEGGKADPEKEAAVQELIDHVRTQLTPQMFSIREMPEGPEGLDEPPTPVVSAVGTRGTYKSSAKAAPAGATAGAAAGTAAAAAGGPSDRRRAAATAGATGPSARRRAAAAGTAQPAGGEQAATPEGAPQSFFDQPDMQSHVEGMDRLGEQFEQLRSSSVMTRESVDELAKTLDRTTKEFASTGERLAKSMGDPKLAEPITKLTSAFAADRARLDSDRTSGRVNDEEYQRRLVERMGRVFENLKKAREVERQQRGGKSEGEEET